MRGCYSSFYYFLWLLFKASYVKSICSVTCSLWSLSYPSLLLLLILFGPLWLYPIIYFSILADIPELFWFNTLDVFCTEFFANELLCCITFKFFIEHANVLGLLLIETKEFYVKGVLLFFNFSIVCWLT